MTKYEHTYQQQYVLTSHYNQQLGSKYLNSVLICNEVANLVVLFL